MRTIYDKSTAPQAPDMTVLDRDGSEISLSRLWTDHDLTVLAFTRHLGCTFFSHQMGDLERNKQQIDHAEIPVALIGPADLADLRAKLKTGDLPYDLYLDPTGAAFDAYGLGETTFLGNFRHPSIMVDTINALRQGARPGGSLGDSAKLPGVMIVDRDGQLRMRRASKHAGDIMPASEVIRAIIDIRQMDRDGR